MKTSVDSVFFVLSIAIGALWCWALATGCASSPQRIASNAQLADIQVYRPADRVEYPACCEIVASVQYSSHLMCVENAIDCPGTFTCISDLCAGLGDFDNDGNVDLADYVVFMAAFTGDTR